MTVDEARVRYASISRPLTCIGILTLALTLRIIGATILPDQSSLLHDVETFRLSGEQIIKTWRVDNHFVMPLYPLLIAVTGPGLGQLAADILISTFTVLIIFQLSYAIFKDFSIAATAGLLSAIYPPLIFFSLVGLSETLFIALVLLSFLYWYSGDFTLAAVAAVLAVLARPVFDLIGLLLVFQFALIVHQLDAVQVAKKVAIYAAVYCLLMTPWWLHNYASYGTFVRLNPGFGTALYAGNNPLNKTGGANLGVDYDKSEFMKIENPVLRDRALRDAAIAFIVENPMRVIELSVRKIVRMWQPWPSHAGYSNWIYRLGLFFSFMPLLALTVLYLARFGLSELRLISPILVFAIYYVLVHAILAGTIRYRLPLEPFMIIFSAAAFIRLYRNKPTGSMSNA